MLMPCNSGHVWYRQQFCAHGVPLQNEAQAEKDSILNELRETNEVRQPIICTGGCLLLHRQLASAGLMRSRAGRCPVSARAALRVRHLCMPRATLRARAALPRAALQVRHLHCQGQGALRMSVPRPGHLPPKSVRRVW